MIKLYGYWRSTAAWRVRLALQLKNIPYQSISIHLVKNGGEQHQQEYAQLNPQKLVPFLIDGEVRINQSFAMLEYLEEAYPEHLLLPKEISLRAEIRSFCQMIACDIHPLNNLRVLQYLQNQGGLSDENKNQWYQHWIAEGFTALEERIKARQQESKSDYIFADQPTLAEVCLIPQIYNAKRFNCDLQPFPLIQQIDEKCGQLKVFKAAQPDQQDDAQ